ncbi:phage baseplate protein [Paenibacillus antarcticus]|uniref:Dit-like phage tail protein N-terminal domain-containing protein n=1 Tax=Paenibacillus antarcticus TaxID=253703 RepID=A0A168QVQ1_9BACL|nr:hypothetical protein [Paenibacillus antarcticus]OAB48271.1 hypothetical protein PBAT_01115 [Paenibacillus antarcticus]
MALLNGHYILVEDESPSYEVEITDQPVDRDIDLSDHVQRKARTLSISGVIVGDHAVSIRAMIVKAQDQGEIVQFSGRTTFRGLISGFSPKHDHTIMDGFAFTLSMKEVRIAGSSYVKVPLPAPIKAQVAKAANAGVKQPLSKKNSAAKPINSNSNTVKTTPKKTITSKAPKSTHKRGTPWEMPM